MVYLYAFMAFGLIALILAAIYRPLGDYMYRVYTTDKDLFFEKWIYRIIGVDSSKGQSWKAYFRGVLGFSVMSLLVLYLLQRVQSGCRSRWASTTCRLRWRSTRPHPS